MDSNGKLRVGVVGLGVGRSHIQAFQELGDRFEVVAVCDLDEAKAREIAEADHIPYYYKDFDRLCLNNDVDVIDLCTPPFLHYSQMLQALAAGKHVICEKPLVGSLKEVDELDRAQQKAQRVLMPIFQYRFGHGLQKLLYLRNKGLTGQAYLTTIETAWRRRAEYYAVPWRGKWKTELGGTLAGHSSHTHDMLTYILGPVKEVFARITTRVNPVEVEDCASISFEMADGSLASSSTTVGSSAEISRHRFCFSNLTAESNLRPYTNSGDPWSFVPDNSEVGAQIEEALAEFVPLPESRKGQFYRFSLALQQNEPLPVTLADGRASIELLTAIYYSAYTKQSVSLPIANDHPFYAGWIPYFS
ncbi:MAG TPA: Gfo/Idh/MocA family oxidoreductase [Chloroflexia bacterium]|nr:Gfo/Idh/MocA family oxidoreductase [Chloroflexia bacterium]